MQNYQISYVSINIACIKKTQSILRAFNHILRRQILSAIEGKGNKMIVTDIYTTLRIEQSVASQHLAILRNAGLVTTVREGKFIYYSVCFKSFELIKSYCEGMTAKIKDLAA